MESLLYECPQSISHARPITALGSRARPFRARIWCGGSVARTISARDDAGAVIQTSLVASSNGMNRETRSSVPTIRVICPCPVRSSTRYGMFQPFDAVSLGRTRQNRVSTSGMLCATTSPP